uniref:Uncharacterized protein n=1 Tax=Eptatretus burgeri TaxID=7764 RepID=A0A8C4N3C0_EPTBU
HQGVNSACHPRSAKWVSVKQPKGCTRSASQTALEKELELCTLAIHHYYSNNYDKAAAILKQSSGLGLYIPVTQATLAVMAAMLQFEPAAMETAIQRLREALDAISRFRRKTGRDIPSEVELHAELCYAECLLLRACISFLQVFFF